jgi:hypothetical protein
MIRLKYGMSLQDNKYGWLNRKMNRLVEIKMEIPKIGGQIWGQKMGFTRYGTALFRLIR